MRSTITTSGHAPPPPQARELVVGGRGAAAEHLVVQRLGRGEQRAGAAGEAGLTARELVLPLEQLGLECLEGVERGPFPCIGLSGGGALERLGRSLRRGDEL